MFLLSPPQKETPLKTQRPHKEHAFSSILLPLSETPHNGSPTSAHPLTRYSTSARAAQKDGNITSPFFRRVLPLCGGLPPRGRGCRRRGDGEGRAQPVEQPAGLVALQAEQ